MGRSALNTVARPACFYLKFPLSEKSQVVTPVGSTLADRFDCGRLSARRIVDEFRGMENLKEAAEASTACNVDLRPVRRSQSVTVGRDFTRWADHQIARFTSPTRTLPLGNP